MQTQINRVVLHVVTYRKYNPCDIVKNHRKKTPVACIIFKLLTIIANSANHVKAMIKRCVIQAKIKFSSFQLKFVAKGSLVLSL